MNTESKNARLAKNATYLTIASVIQKAMTFAYYGFLARSIGTEGMGKYTFALTMGSVFVIFMDIGLGTLLTREVAKHKDSLQSTFNRFFSLKIVAIAFSLLAFIVTIHFSEAIFTNIDTLDVQLMYIAAAIIVFDTLAFTAFSVMRALQRLGQEAIAIVIYQATVISAGIAAIINGFPLTVVLSALLLGSLLQCAFMWSAVRRETQLTFTFQFAWDDAKKLLALAAPFAISGIIFKLNGSVDGIMLKILKGDDAAGIYGLAFKLTFALMVVPGAFATSYYPAMSEYFKTAKEKMGPVFSRALRYMALLSFPIAAGTIVLGDNLIQLIWPEFEQAIPALIVFMLALPFLFANYPIGNLLNAANLQRRNTAQMCVALLVNIALNAVLIPLYDVLGAAIAQLVSSVVLIALGLPLAYSVAPFAVAQLTRRTLALGLAALLMAGAVWLVQDLTTLVVSIAIGAIVYPAAVLALGGVSIKELSLMKKAVTGKL